MAFQTQVQQITGDKLKKEQRFQVAVNNDFELQPTGENVKVLSLDISFKGRNVVVEDKKATVGGKINYKIIYLDENTVKFAGYEADFSNVISDETFTSGDILLLDTEVLESEYSLAGKTLKTSCALDMILTGVERTSAEAVFACEDGYCKTTEEGTQTVKSSNKNVIDVFGDYSVGESVEETVGFESAPILQSAVCDDGKITYSGKVVCRVCFRFSRGLETRYYDIPFNEEVKADGAVQNGVCYAVTSLESDKLTIIGDGNSSSVEIEVKVGISALTFGKNNYLLCSDVFSSEMPLTVQREKFSFSEIKYQKFFEEKVNAGQTFGNDVAIKNVINLFGTKISSSEITSEDGVLTVGGTILCDLAYADYEGEIKSLKTEVPFLFKRGAVEAGERDELFYSVSLGAVSPRVRRDNEIELTADVYVGVTAFEEKAFEYISQVQQGEAYGDKQPLVSIYFAEKGDTVWEIGKALRCSPETVKKLNPDLGDVLTGKEKVVIVRKNI